MFSHSQFIELRATALISGLVNCNVRLLYWQRICVCKHLLIWKHNLIVRCVIFMWSGNIYKNMYGNLAYLHISYSYSCLHLNKLKKNCTKYAFFFNLLVFFSKNWYCSGKSLLTHQDVVLCSRNNVVFVVKIVFDL